MREFLFIISKIGHLVAIWLLCIVSLTSCMAQGGLERVDTLYDEYGRIIKIGEEKISYEFNLNAIEYNDVASSLKSPCGIANVKHSCESSCQLNWFDVYFGDAVGVHGNMLAHDIDGDGIDELIASTNSYRYNWVIAKFDDGTGSYEIVHTCENNNSLYGQVLRIKLFDFNQDGILELFIATGRRIEIIDLNTLSIIERYYHNQKIVDFEVIDIDADGDRDLILEDFFGFQIYDFVTRDLVLSIDADAKGFAVGNVDDDQSLELVSTEGKAYEIYTDGTYIQEYDFSAYGFSGGSELKMRLADIDGDGKEEAIYGGPWLHVVNVDTEDLIYSRNDIAFRDLLITNVDLDPEMELVLAGDQWDDIECLNIATGISEWKIDNLNHTNYALAIGDMDGDGFDELAISAGSADHKLFIFDLTTRVQEFVSEQVSSFGDIQIRDLDNDGREEFIVTASHTDHVSVSLPTIKIYDLESRDIIAQLNSDSLKSIQPNVNLVEDYIVFDFGNDGDLDILMTSNGAWPNPSSIWVLDGITLEVEFYEGNFPYDHLEYKAIEDFDDDGELEVLVHLSGFKELLVLNAADFTIEWESSFVLYNCLLDDYDGDSHQEIIGKDDNDNWLVIYPSDNYRVEIISNYISLPSFDLDNDGKSEYYELGGIIKFYDKDSLNLIRTVDLNPFMCDIDLYGIRFVDSVFPVDFNNNGIHEMLFFFDNFAIHINESFEVEIRQIPAIISRRNNSQILRDIDGDNELELLACSEAGIYELDIDCFECYFYEAQISNSIDFCNKAGTIVGSSNDPTTTFEIQENGMVFKDSISGLSAGIYTIHACNSSNCSKIIDIEIEGVVFDSDISVTDLTCIDNIDGEAIIEVISGIPPFTYDWSNSSVNDTITNLSVGNYYVTITDGDGCEHLDSTVVSVNNLQGDLLAIDLTTCIGESTGSARFTTTTPWSFSYFWDGVEGTIVNNSLTVGMHTLVVVDQNDCDWPFDFEVTGLEVEVETLQLAPSCALDPNGSAEVNVTKGSAPYQYRWSTGFTGSNQLSNVPAGMYVVTVTDAALCSTTAMVEIEQRDLETINLSESICYEDSYSYLDSAWSSPGIYHYPINSCDSVLVLDLTVRDEASSMLEQSICEGDSVELLGQYYSVADDYSLMTTNQYGCDSTIAFRLTVTDKIEVYEPVRICEGDSVLLFGNYEMTAGTLSESYVTTSGCDSTQFYDISVEQIPTADIQETICEGDSIYIADTWFRVAGTYELVKPSIGLCDSVISINIDQIDLTVLYDSLRICEGDSIELYGDWIKEAGDYEYLVDNMPCKDRLQVKVELDPTETSSETIFLCPGDSILIDNSWISRDTTLQELLTSFRGCDSLVYKEIVVYDYPDPPALEIDCEDMVVLASVNISSDWSILWSNGDSSEETIFDTQGEESILFSAAPDCIVNYEINIPALPDPMALDPLEDKTISRNQSVMIDLQLSDEYQIIWSPADIIDCDSCMNVEITPVTTTSIEAIITHTSGCIYTQNFIINISEKFDVYIPTAFSPNGDDVNERFKAYLPDGLVANVVKFHVYDRWGELIYAIENIPSDHPNMGWDGKFKGEPVMSGVYLYSLSIDGGEQGVLTRTGDVSVIR